LEEMTHAPATVAKNIKNVVENPNEYNPYKE